MVFTNTRNMNKLFKGNQDITLVFKRISLKKRKPKIHVFIMIPILKGKKSI